jgi:hypothetical protein
VKTVTQAECGLDDWTGGAKIALDAADFARPQAVVLFNKRDLKACKM